MRIPQNALEAIGLDALSNIASFLEDPHSLIDSSQYFRECINDQKDFWKTKFNQQKTEVFPGMMHLMALVDPNNYLINLSTMERYNHLNHYKMAYYYGKCFNEFIKREKQRRWNDTIDIIEFMALFNHQIEDHSNNCKNYPYKQLYSNSENCNAHFDLKIMQTVSKLWEEEEKKKQKLKILRLTKPLWIWVKPLCFVYIYIFDYEHYHGNYWFDA